MSGIPYDPIETAPLSKDEEVVITPINPTNLPMFVRKFIYDFVETAIAAIFLLNIAFPNSIAATEQAFITVGVATFSALVSALRRATPGFLEWLKSKLNIG